MVLTTDAGAKEPVKLLWTSGWDSTFQLLRLLLFEKKPVQPYYLIDDNRASHKAEIIAMDKIRQKLNELYPYTKDLLLPTEYYRVSEIAPDSDISEAFKRLTKNTFMGIQYEWLARYLSQFNIKNIQLGIHKDDKANILRNKNEEGTDEQKIFGYYTFPLMGVSKLKMQETSKEQGWDNIMEMTWFCHKPKKNNPCGKCNPCRYTIEEGMARRIPLFRRTLGYIKIIKRKIKGKK
jgi:7-cyano-7-deazaguanine synthase in queuosine biosynthesis